MRDRPTITFINAHLIPIFALSAFVFLALCILLASGATAPLRHEAGRVSVWTAQHCLLSSRLWRQPRWLRRRRPLPSVTVASVAVATAPPARARQQPPPRRPLPPPLPSWPPAVGARPSKEAATRRRRRGFTAAAPPPLSPLAATARDGSPPVTPRRGLGSAGGSAAAARRAPLGHRVVGRWRWQTAALGGAVALEATTAAAGGLARRGRGRLPTGRQPWCGALPVAVATPMPDAVRTAAAMPLSAAFRALPGGRGRAGQGRARRERPSCAASAFP